MLKTLKLRTTERYRQNGILVYLIALRSGLNMGNNSVRLDRLEQPQNHLKYGKAYGIICNSELGMLIKQRNLLKTILVVKP